MEKISLSGDMETLLIPLYGKAREMLQPYPFLQDPMAADIIDQVDMDFKDYNIPNKTNRLMSLRARIIDDFTRRFLKNHPNTLVLHLGCGLDSRCKRVTESRRLWIDLDYPEVISLRKKFFPEGEGYQMIGSSATDFSWMNQVPEHQGPVLVLAEGMMMYLRQEQAGSLLAAMGSRLGLCHVVFDVFSTATAKRVHKHPSLKKVGVTQLWGVDDSREMEPWVSNLTWQEDLCFTNQPLLKEQPLMTRLLYRLTDHISAARNAHRIAVFQLGKGLQMP